MGVIFFIIAIISGSALLTFGVVKATPKIQSLKTSFRFPKINLSGFRWRKKTEQELNYDEYELNDIFIDGVRVPSLVPKKPKEVKGEMPLPLTKNIMIMAGVVVVGVLVGYYVTKKSRK